MALGRNHCRFGEGVVGAGSCDCVLAQPLPTERNQFNTEVRQINGQNVACCLQCGHPWLKHPERLPFFPPIFAHVFRTSFFVFLFSCRSCSCFWRFPFFSNSSFETEWTELLFVVCSAASGSATVELERLAIERAKAEEKKAEAEEKGWSWRKKAEAEEKASKAKEEAVNAFLKLRLAGFDEADDVYLRLLGDDTQPTTQQAGYGIYFFSISLFSYRRNS